MDKNLNWKIIFITVLLLVAAGTLYPPQKTLKPGIDLAGGTSLIYEIDTAGLQEAEKKDLAQKMITVLRRRIDPANIQNLIWRPQGSSRFEIQMPLASAEARQKRHDFEDAINELLAANINTATIMRSLQKPAQQRDEEFQSLAKGSETNLTILKNLSQAHDERLAAQKKRDELAEKLAEPENIIKTANLDLAQIKTNVGSWTRLNDEKLKEALVEFLGNEDNLELLTGYVKMYDDWAKAVENLIDSESGKEVLYKNARRQLDKFNLSAEQINYILDLPENSLDRGNTITKLKTDFPDRSDKIDRLLAAFEEYRPFRGRLDDPKDLQRMLKGAGILEFRILPTAEQPDIDPEEMTEYVKSLQEKGPKYASDNNYVWCQIEDIQKWKRPDAVVGTFGNKYYVLASNKTDQCILHRPGQKQWSLKRAQPDTDQQGRRAIGFALDERGGKLFGNITGKNIGKPLCILLDDIAISAPNVQSKIYSRGIITGSFAQTEIDDMVNKLNAGSLPARLIEQPISVKTIGPSIGADNRDKGIKAGLIGLVAVLLCMAVYYTLAGAIANVALLANLLFVLAIMALVRATFTLPGIAGIILTIGMSVDANVLIFERIREEQQRGSSLRIAVKNGYQKAFRTILDANITTFITAAILFWVASEEIKGFAIVLMLGIVSSMFTALFVTRVIFDWLLARKIISDHLLMLMLIRKPNVNWMAKRPIFIGISSLLILGGLTVFLTRDDAKNNKYDIEFTGGTTAVINLKEDLPIQQVRDRLADIANKLENPALAAANVYSINKSAKQYEINTTETNKSTADVTFSPADKQTAETITTAIGTKLPDFAVKPDAGDPNRFIVTTRQTSRSLIENTLKGVFPTARLSEPKVDEVVNRAILAAFAEQLQIQQNLEPRLVSSEKISDELIDAYPELADFLGGLKILCQTQKPVTIQQLRRRINDLRFKPDMQNLNWYSYKILKSDLTGTEPGEQVQTFVYLSIEPEAGFRELSPDEWGRFVENEKSKLLAATEMESSLPRVTQIAPSIGAEAKTRALIAIVLSLFSIVAYIWIRFGNLRYGIAAIVALIHDVCITLGAVTVCTYIAATPIGEKLLIGDFKINLAMIAALLTIIGYSLNDTIVVFDRIRENRRKDRPSPAIITSSINQTLSRTLLTSFTTFIVVLIMYVFGGQALRGFTFAIGFGIIIGTYSSIAIAAPTLLLGSGKREKNKYSAGRKI